MRYAPWSRTSWLLRSASFYSSPRGGRYNSAPYGPPVHRSSLANDRFFLHVAFSSYGAFWLSFATLFIPGSGVADAYKTAKPGMEDDAIGIFLLAWMIVTFLFL
jgi:GPR1/FUN34/yaaH family